MSSSCVNLTLKTTSILADNAALTYFGNVIDNNIGTVDNNRTSITWKNINLKTLLGSLYEKYDLCNISLNYIAGAGVGTTSELSDDNRFFQVKLSGLQFLSSYNQASQTNNNVVLLNVVKAPLTASSTWVVDSFALQSYTFR